MQDVTRSRTTERLFMPIVAARACSVFLNDYRCELVGTGWALRPGWALRLAHRRAKCLLAAAPLLVNGQAKPAAKAESASVEQTLMQLERDWTQAGLKKDAGALERIIADDWAGIDFEGKTFTKAQVMADLKSGAAPKQTSRLAEKKGRVF